MAEQNEMNESASDFLKEIAERKKAEEAKVETPEQKEVEAEVNTEVEAKTEEEVETEAQVEGEAENEEDENKKFLDLLNTTESEKPEVVENKLSEELEALKKELEASKSKLQKYEANPFLQAFEYGETVDDLKKVAKELAGNDYSKASYAELARLEAQRIAEAAGEELTPEEIESEVELMVSEFEGESKLTKAKILMNLRNTYQEQNNALKSETLEKLKQAYESKKPANMDAVIAEAEKEDKEAIKSLGKKIIGQKFYGVEFTEAELSDILEKEYTFDKASQFDKGDGKIAADKFILSTFRERNFERMINAEVEKRVAKLNKQNVVVNKPTKGSAPLQGSRDNKADTVNKLVNAEWSIKN